MTKINDEPVKLEVTLPNNQLDSDFVDNNYWQANACEETLDDLLSDYE